MFEATLWWINTKSDMIMKVVRLYSKDEELLETVVVDYIDANSSEKMCIRYIIVEVEDEIYTR